MRWGSRVRDALDIPYLLRCQPPSLHEVALCQCCVLRSVNEFSVQSGVAPVDNPINDFRLQQQFRDEKMLPSSLCFCVADSRCLLEMPGDAILKVTTTRSKCLIVWC